MFSLKLQGVDRLLSALNMMIQEATASESSLPYEGAVAYGDALHGAITGQKFPGTAYKDLNDRYAAWKQKTVHHTDFWRLYGNLRASLNVWQAGKAWGSGLPENAGADSKGRDIEMYAGVNEEKRPLFEPILEELEKNKWQSLSFEVMSKLGLLWKG